MKRARGLGLLLLAPALCFADPRPEQPEREGTLDDFLTGNSSTATRTPSRPPPPDQTVAERNAERAPEMRELDHDHGFGAGTVRQQLERDTNLVPFGKGAVFVPAMANPLDEPPIVVWRGSNKIAEGPTGRRMILDPGTYELELGSGPREQRMRVQFVVRTSHTTVVPPSWSGLSIHVIDEQFGSLRGSYEIIRVSDREYIGLGFGTDEQAGEPVTTWVVRPGLYRIVRVGETYRARRDFITVRLLPAQHTHVLLVMDRDTGSFAGGGEVQEDQLFRPREGFSGSLVLGTDLSMNTKLNVPGLPEGIGFSLRAFLDGRATARIFGNPFYLQLQIEQGQTKGPGLPFQKTNDRVDLDLLYVYEWTNWIGPYARLGAETNLIPGKQFFIEPVDLVLRDGNGVELERRNGAGELSLSPSLGLSTIKEGVGMNIRLLKTLFAETTVRTGFGARHRLTRDLYELADDAATPALEYNQIPTTNQVGIETTILATARITRWVLLNLELDSLLPFSDPGRLILEIENSITLKLTSFISVNYVIRYLRDRDLSSRDRFEQDILLRASLELF